MTKERPTNLAASVRQRLLNIARARQEDFQLTLGRYALERLVYRLGQTQHRELFVLKGAILFHLWTDEPHRPTRDLDLLGTGESSIARIEEVFREICLVDVQADGLEFRSDSVIGSVIKPDQKYQGVRILLQGRLERTRIPVQVDVGFGDIVSPEPALIDFPSMLGFPTTEVATYPKETVVAEKLQALVVLGMANTRMKDFYDLWVMSRRFEFDGQRLTDAIRATFARRETAVPTRVPLALTDEFYRDQVKQAQWLGFRRRIGAAFDEASLEDVALAIREFLMPPLESVRQCVEFSGRWKGSGSWQNS